MSHQLVIEPAAATDVAAYLRLRDEAARVMVSAGIQQWQPGELTEAGLRDWIGDGQLIGGFFLLWSDAFWNDGPTGAVVQGRAGSDGRAGYTHGLVVDRSYQGAGLGRQLLSGAENRIRAAGRGLSRLDTVRSNHRLRRYYRDAGYTEVGERTFDDGKVFDDGAPIEAVTLLEKRLD